MKKLLLMSVVLAIMVLSMPGGVLAQQSPQTPHAFWGTLKINDVDAPVGTTIKATGVGVIIGLTDNPIVTVRAGEYGWRPDGPALVVQGEIADGATLEFYVNGVKADQEAEFHSGGVTRLDLTVTIADDVWALQLGEGWNIVSTPIALDASCDTWQEFVTLDDGLDWVIAYYYEGGIFKLIQKEPAYAFRPCNAVYVYMNSADTVTIIPNSGITPPPSRMLSSGWNLVGSAFVETEEMPVNQALISIYYAPGIGGAWGYSTVISPGESFNQAGWVYSRDFGPVPNMVVGKGYWVFMVNAGEYAGQTYTPWP